MNPDYSSMSAVIDLTVPRLVRYARLPSREVMAVDDLSYDPDPTSRWHCHGYGRTEPEALADLLDQLSEAKHGTDR